MNEVRFRMQICWQKYTVAVARDGIIRLGIDERSELSSKEISGDIYT